MATALGIQRGDKGGVLSMILTLCEGTTAFY